MPEPRRQLRLFQRVRFRQIDWGFGQPLQGEHRKNFFDRPRGRVKTSVGKGAIHDKGRDSGQGEPIDQATTDGDQPCCLRAAA